MIEDVGRLDVPVDNALECKVIECFEHLVEKS